LCQYPFINYLEFKTGIGNKNTLFHYSVEIQADPEFLIEMNKRACVKETVSNPTAAAINATDDNIQEANNGIAEDQNNDGTIDLSNSITE
jgi:hypothetical protein